MLREGLQGARGSDTAQPVLSGVLCQGEEGFDAADGAPVPVFGGGDLKQPLDVNSVGTLNVVGSVGEGVARKYINHPLTISFRQGGEKIQPVGRKEKHALKKLFQESGVPPWIRERTPLIYIDGELAAVGGMFIEQKFHAADGEDSYIFQWTSAHSGISA